MGKKKRTFKEGEYETILKFGKSYLVSISKPGYIPLRARFNHTRYLLKFGIIKREEFLDRFTSGISQVENEYPALDLAINFYRLSSTVPDVLTQLLLLWIALELITDPPENIWRQKIR